MNRPIKFRAWDKERGVMMPSVGFTDSDCGRAWIREFYMVDDGAYSQSGNWIPMQFTGLFDKNGVEIWEGDVVKEEYESIFYWEIGYRNGAFVDGEGESTLYEMNIEDGRLTALEVVGNKFNNPELLN